LAKKKKTNNNNLTREWRCGGLCLGCIYIYILTCNNYSHDFMTFSNKEEEEGKRSVLGRRKTGLESEKGYLRVLSTRPPWTALGVRKGQMFDSFYN
jgi:hypothetical protein